jgi:hypothetical protein
VFRRGTRQLQAAGAYREVASALGLAVDTRGASLHGVLAGRPLWVGEVMVGHGPERRTEVHGVIGMRRSLGLGLDLRRRARRRDQGVPLGDPELERRLVATAAWPEGLVGTLDAGSRAPLLAVVKAHPAIEITDDQVRVRMPRALHRPSDLAAVVEELEGLAAALESARAAIQAPVPLQAWIEPWADLADRFDLGLVPTLPALRGRCGDHLVEIAPEWRGDRYFARICALFEPDEFTGLRLEPQRGPDGYHNVGQDIQVGDAAFDAAFVVKGFDPEEIRARLTPAVREDLIALLADGEVTVDDHRLCLAAAAPEPASLARVLPRLLRVADLLAPPAASAPRWLSPGAASPRRLTPEAGEER